MELLAKVFADVQTIEKEHEAEAVTKAKKGWARVPQNCPSGQDSSSPFPQNPQEPQEAGRVRGAAPACTPRSTSQSRGSSSRFGEILPSRARRDMR